MANYPAFYPQSPNMYQQNMGYQQPFGGAQMPNSGVPMAGNVPAQPQSQNGFMCVPVTSREEAVATRVEAFGPPALMPDFGHGMIYFKRFNEKTALADFAEFKLVPEANQTEQAETKPSVDLAALAGALQKRLDKIAGKFDGMDEKFGSIEDKVDSLTEKLESRARKKATSKGADDE